MQFHQDFKRALKTLGKLPHVTVDNVIELSLLVAEKDKRIEELEEQLNLKTDNEELKKKIQ